MFLLIILFSFTDYPYLVYHWLGTHNAEVVETPDYIVVMGAGGMPGPEGLMRCHFAAKSAEQFPNAKVIVALPSEEENFNESDAYRMFLEINIKGVHEDRFIFESKGTNTYSQATEIYTMLLHESNQNLLIVTSPEHMHRCILTFKKCGFENVGGVSSFESSYNDDLLLTKEERSKRVQDVNRSLSLRYNMWNYLKYEITIMREMMALAWYKIKGYI
jgi:uncharacterized SAM-binding protein YcdF (DUF218 family)